MSRLAYPYLVSLNLVSILHHLTQFVSTCAFVLTEQVIGGVDYLHQSTDSAVDYLLTARSSSLEEKSYKKRRKAYSPMVCAVGFRGVDRNS